MYCSKCGTNNLSAATTCSACGFTLANIERTELVYAGFWKRFAALFIDGLILGFASLLVIFILAFTTGADSVFFMVMIYVLTFAMSAAYFTLMESGVHGATYGKRWLDLKVLDTQGQRLTRSRAFVRWMAHALSDVTLYIGYLIQPFTENKQALHDIVSSTTVIDENPEGKTGGLIIALVIGTLVVIFMLGVLAAIAIPAYAGYVGKAKVAQAYPKGLDATRALDVYFVANGKLPDSLSEANIQNPNDATSPSELLYDTQSGRLLIEFKENQGAGIAGKHLLYTPTLLIDNTLEWKCSSPDIRPDLLIAPCK